MAKKRKPGGGRKPLPADQRKVQFGFRVAKPILEGMQRLAHRNDRSVAAEISLACKKHLQRYDKPPDVAS